MPRGSHDCSAEEPICGTAPRLVCSWPCLSDGWSSGGLAPGALIPENMQEAEDGGEELEEETNEAAKGFEEETVEAPEAAEVLGEPQQVP